MKRKPRANKENNSPKPIRKIDAVKNWGMRINQIGVALSFWLSLTPARGGDLNRKRDYRKYKEGVLNNDEA